MTFEDFENLANIVLVDIDELAKAEGKKRLSLHAAWNLRALIAKVKIEGVERKEKKNEH